MSPKKEGSGKSGGIGNIVAVFLGCIVGLALTPTVVDLVTTQAALMAAGAARTLLLLFPMFWTIFLMAIPLGSVALYIQSKAKQGSVSISDIIGVFLPSIVGLSLTGTVAEMVANTTVAMAAGATKTLLLLFPMFWVIFLIGIPVTAIAVYFYYKKQGY